MKSFGLKRYNVFKIKVMNKVVAKFECYEAGISEHDDEVVNIGMTAAIYGDENKEWAHYTPSGSVTMAINKDVPAVTILKAGKSYLVTFEEVVN